MTITHFVYPSTDGHLACFQSWQLWIVLLWAWACKYSLWISAFSSLGLYPEVGWLDHMVTSFLIFLRNHPAVFHSDYTILHSYQQRTRVPIALRLCPHLLYIYIFESSHPNGCEVIAYWGLICISLMISDVEHRFLCLLAIPPSFFLFLRVDNSLKKYIGFLEREKREWVRL